MWQGEFRDPRLVEVYDAQFGWSREDDFFLSVVGESPSVRVVDLGCGTGRLALALAGAGHAVTAVDPARASLDAARVKPGAGRVTWVEGTSQSLADAAFDVALMTSHVAQVLVEEEDCLSFPEGRLVFDTRDPRARLWERWNPLDSRRVVNLQDGTVVHVWTEVTDVQHGTVSFTLHYVLPAGEEILSTATMRFRSEEDVRAAVSDAGFVVEHVFGGWNREPTGSGDGELLILARRPLV